MDLSATPSSAIIVQALTRMRRRGLRCLLNVQLHAASFLRFQCILRRSDSEQPTEQQPCNFKGAGVKQQSKSISGCDSLTNQVGAAGTGTVTSAPTAAVSGGAPASSSSSGAATPLGIPSFDFGLLRLAVYVSVAAMVGAAMVVL